MSSFRNVSGRKTAGYRPAPAYNAAVALIIAFGAIGAVSTLSSSCSGLNLDRRSWEVERGCPLDCFPESADGKVSEAPYVGTQRSIDEPPFDLTGTWAQRQLTATITAAPLLGESINSNVNTLRMEVVQDGFQLRMTAEVCRIDQSTTSSAGTSFIPQSFIDTIGLTERTVTIERTDWGYRYLEDLYVRVLGAELEDPLNDPVPVDESDPRIVDSDNDGHLGITVGIDGIVDGEVYVVQRHWEELCGRVMSEDRIDGYIRWHADQEVVGASSFILDHTPETSTHPDWELNRFELRRVDDELTCESILANAEAIFAE